MVLNLKVKWGHAVTQLVEALRYKPKVAISIPLVPDFFIDIIIPGIFPGVKAAGV
jgi:hypothetical protein